MPRCTGKGSDSYECPLHGARSQGPGIEAWPPLPHARPIPPCQQGAFIPPKAQEPMKYPQSRRALANATTYVPAPRKRRQRVTPGEMLALVAICVGLGILVAVSICAAMLIHINAFFTGGQ